MAVMRTVTTMVLVVAMLNLLFVSSIGTRDDDQFIPRVLLPIVLHDANDVIKINVTVAYAFMTDRWLRIDSGSNNLSLLNDDNKMPK